MLIYLLYLNTFFLKLHFYRAYQIIDLQNSATADKPFGIKIREETILKAAKCPKITVYIYFCVTITNSAHNSKLFPLFHQSRHENSLRGKPQH